MLETTRVTVTQHACDAWRKRFGIPDLKRLLATVRCAQTARPRLRAKHLAWQASRPPQQQTFRRWSSEATYLFSEDADAFFVVRFTVGGCSVITCYRLSEIRQAKLDERECA